MELQKKIIINIGDPAGIGPDLCLSLSSKKFPANIVIVGNKKTIIERAKLLNRDIKFNTDKNNHEGNNSLSIIETSYPEDVVPGIPNKKNSFAQFSKMKFIVNQLINKEYDALVTLPISKNTLSNEMSGFIGHTEYISQLAKTKGQEVMMLASEKLRVALVTTHVSLKDVSRLITPQKLSTVIKNLDFDLKKRFKIKKPKIVVTGLNPHAGENGDFGDEEKKIISPVIKKLNAQGFNLVGPIPADSAFTEKYINDCDSFLAMFHDQGLTPFKALSFGKGVNITLGLPFVRTSVDHGTAFDIAGKKGKVNPTSFYEAINMAIKLS